MSSRMKDWAGYGTWRPAILTSSDVVSIKIVFAVIAIMRGIDYAMDCINGVAPSDAVENALPPYVWAAVCFLVGVLLIVGMIARAHWAVFYGHFLGAVSYAALAAGALQHALTVTPPDDWRRAGALLGIAFVHWTLAKRSGVAPITKSREAVEHVVAPAASS